MAKTGSAFTPLVCVVDFHHARGPEVEKWFGVPERGEDPSTVNDWSLLPFLALSDGSHAVAEELSYFTLRQRASTPDPTGSAANGKPAPTPTPSSSVFGVSCIRQIPARELLNKPADVTRSSVQKAVVAIVENPYLFARIREKLSAVTKAWFAQKDFSDFAIVQDFHESLVQTCSVRDDERDQYFGLSLREIIHEYKHHTLELFKCCLLQPKMLFFGTQCERLCLLQFSLISLIPGLLRALQDCADPSFNTYEESLVMPSSLRTSDRSSLLTYMGQPLQIFGKGSLFGPYTPLQGLDVLADTGTKSYIVGSTNSLLLSQKERYCDVLVNVDEHSISIFSPSLRSALALSPSDRRWIDFMTQTVNDTWDEDNPSLPTTHGYAGSEDFIRLQFEEYLLALVSSLKYRQYVEKTGHDQKALVSEAQGDPANDFGPEWIEAWTRTDNYRIFNKFTDSHLFDIVEPRHPCAGGLTMEDVQRRIAQQVAELHLDERFNSSREVIGKHLATGQKVVSTAFNNLWADIEVMREAQRKKYEERKSSADSNATGNAPAEDQQPASIKSSLEPQLAKAQANVQAASARAGAYLSSWGTWAAERRKQGWNRNSATSQPESSATQDDTVSKPAKRESSSKGETTKSEGGA